MAKNSRFCQRSSLFRFNFLTGKNDLYLDKGEIKIQYQTTLL
jgi:hypothetical protein